MLLNYRLTVLDLWKSEQNWCDFPVWAFGAGAQAHPASTPVQGDGAPEASHETPRPRLQVGGATAGEEWKSLESE